MEVRMIVRILRSGLVLISLFTLLAGCTIQLRSPIKISRDKDEKQSPPQEVVRAPAQQPRAEQIAPRQDTTAPAISKPSPATRASAADIPIISEYYLSDTPYDVLGNISVRDVSGQGFTKDEARRALQSEAFHRFGSRADAIINVTLVEDKNWLGADAITEARGDVVSRLETVPAKETTSSPPPTYQSASAPPAIPSYEERTPEQVPPQPYQPPSQQEPAYALDEEARKPQGGVSAPAEVLLLGDQDLVDYKFWVLGRISVYSKSGDGFSAEEANRALKAEAFRRYGDKARGIINVAYKEKKGLLDWGGDKLREASGDVVNWEDRGGGAPLEYAPPPPTQQATLAPPAPSPPPYETGVSQPSAASAPVAPYSSPQSQAMPRSTTGGSIPAAHILVVSPDSLINKDFQFLGKITVESAGKSLDEKSAAEALKVEARKLYGNRARAITNLQYERKPGLLNLNKYGEASADVITWGDVIDDTPPAQAPTVGSAAPYYSRADDESAPEYTTGTSSYMEIAILNKDDLLITQYEVLGPVEYAARDRWGIKPYDADIALRRKAFEKYKGKARAIVNVEYTKASGFNTSPDKVTEVRGDVITW